MVYSIYEQGKLVAKVKDGAMVAMLLAGHGYLDGFLVKADGVVIFNGTKDQATYSPAYIANSYDNFAAMLQNRRYKAQQARLAKYEAQKVRHATVAALAATLSAGKPQG